MSWNKSLDKTARFSSIHTTVGRDFERMRRLEKQQAKREQMLHELQTRRNSHVKWNQRATENILRQFTTSQTQDRPPITLEEFMERERIKQDKIINSKNLANANIRRH